MAVCSSYIAYLDHIYLNLFEIRGCSSLLMFKFRNIVVDFRYVNWL